MAQQPNKPGATKPAPPSPVGNSASVNPGGHSVVVVLAIELLAVGLFTLLAGISNEMGKVVVILLVGFWLIYALTTSRVIAGLGHALQKVANTASS